MEKLTRAKALEKLKKLREQLESQDADIEAIEAEIQQIEAALEKYSKDDITAEIAGILRKKYSDRLFQSGIEGKKEMQKIIAALARRGYSYNDIKSALYIVKDDMNEEDY